MSKRLRYSASVIALFNACLSRTSARSSSVRATVVTGIPCRTVTSSGRSRLDSGAPESRAAG